MLLIHTPLGVDVVEIYGILKKERTGEGSDVVHPKRLISQVI